MKLKYFLRGLASGIVITTLILTISYRAKQSTVSKQDNLVEESMETSEPTKILEEITVTPEITVEITQEPTKESEITQKPTQEPIKEATATPEPTKEPTATPEPTKEPTAVPEPTEEPHEMATEKKVLTITSGMWSDRVARELQAMGVIENAVDFDNYLVRNGYAERLVVGTFEISAGASYDEIARIITKR